jgi:hypothetical protein
MLSFRQSVLLLAVAAGGVTGPVWGQPALTPIQDILYRADGSRFSGTMFIRWNSFQAGDTSNIATSSLTLQIVNGVLKVQLVPTTTATAGAQYGITYSSAGRTQFTESWAVPPSTLTLRVRDVRVSSGTIVGPAAVTTPIQIGDVTGLPNALATRPLQGVGFAIGRTAVINPAGQIDGSAGRLGDCVHVDGSSGTCGGAGGGIVPLFADAEPLVGAINGANNAFTLVRAPSPIDSLILTRNGLRMIHGIDYAIAGNLVTFFLASVPQSGDVLLASYRYANPSDPLSSLTPPQVICSSPGTATPSTTSTQLGSCTIPAGLVETGDRIEIQFHFAHTGTAAGFTGELHWGTATTLTRTSAATETTLVGHASFGVEASGQSWDAQTWGNTFALASAVGSAGADPNQNLTVSFRGNMTSTTTDTVTLLNFTVIRYPAQSNP